MRSVLQVVGSLWFAAVLLVLLMVAMGSATLFESRHGTEQALAVFYRSSWFRGLLVLVAANILAAVCLRYPFTRRHVGFLLTHTGLLVILGGALLTQKVAVEGRVSITEGKTVQSFSVQRDTLTVADWKKNARVSLDLGASGIGGFEVLENHDTHALRLGDLERVEVVRYLPDSVWRREVLNDSPHPDPAIEVSLSPSGREDAAWIFAGQAGTFGRVQVLFRPVTNSEELKRLLAEEPKEKKSSPGMVEVEVGGAPFSFPLESCLNKSVPLGKTGYTLKVLRYLPHAMVGKGGKITNVSDHPENPAVEAEFTGPGGSFKQLAFSRFPDFPSMHKGARKDAVKLAFKAAVDRSARAPVEVLAGPDGRLHARFSGHGSTQVHRSLEVGKSLETPWPGKKFTVLRRFDRARVQSHAELPEKIRKTRHPAVRVRLTGASGNPREIWLPKYTPRSLMFGDARYDLIYGNKVIPLGFEVKLNRFRVGYYPGTRRPRSFESHVTITDPATGRAQDRIISMNNPASHGGYTFYQSDYDLLPEGNRTVLSVSRGPDRPVVYAGYFATILGMIWLLVTRMRAGRRSGRGGQRFCTEDQ